MKIIGCIFTRGPETFNWGQASRRSRSSSTDRRQLHPAGDKRGLTQSRWTRVQQALKAGACWERPRAAAHLQPRHLPQRLRCHGRDEACAGRSGLGGSRGLPLGSLLPGSAAGGGAGAAATAGAAAAAWGCKPAPPTAGTSCAGLRQWLHRVLHALHCTSAGGSRREAACLQG